MENYILLLLKLRKQYWSLFGAKKKGGEICGRQKKDLKIEGHRSASGLFFLGSLFKPCLQCSGK